MRHFFLLGLSAMAAMAFSTASAATLSATTSGTFTGVAGGAGALGVHTSELTWGIGGRSGYGFDTYEASADAPGRVTLGYLDHDNEAILLGSGIRRADLALSVSGNLAGKLFDLSTNAVLRHSETPNNRCTPACPDTFTIDALENFVVESAGWLLTNFELATPGFAAEGASQQVAYTAELSYTAPSPVPLPATLPLLALALSGLGYTFHKRRTS